MSITVNVVGEHCQTAASAYRLLDGPDEKRHWLLRWEYFREPPKPDDTYPLAHVHVNGASEACDLPDLHIPTRRVPLELVIWHLITDWGVGSKHDEWPEILEKSMLEFDRKRTAQ